MDETSEPKRDKITLAANILCAYVANNSLPASDLPAMLAKIYSAVSNLAAAASKAPEQEVESTNATSAQIRKSITPDALISFVDGKAYKSLKRHLGKHGLDMYSYRQRYGLPSDYPSVAANYSEARKAIAKSLGLGRPRKAPVTAPEATTESAADAPETSEPARRPSKKSAA